MAKAAIKIRVVVLIVFENCSSIPILLYFPKIRAGKIYSKQDVNKSVRHAAARPFNFNSVIARRGRPRNRDLEAKTGRIMILIQRSGCETERRAGNIRRDGLRNEYYRAGKRSDLLNPNRRLIACSIA